MTAPLASSIYRLADAAVLIGVMQTPEGPEPLATDLGGESAVVAYTDLSEARSDLPETHRLFSIEVAELLAQLPAHAGLVIDPRSPSPVHVPASGKQAVINASKPFPAGAGTRIGDPAEEPVALLHELRHTAPGETSLRRLWRTWYQVADARPKLLIVYEVTDHAAHGPAAADLVVRAAEKVDYPSPLLVMAVGDLPAEHRDWLLAHTPACYNTA